MMILSPAPQESTRSGKVTHISIHDVHGIPVHSAVSRQCTINTAYCLELSTFAWFQFRPIHGSPASTTLRRLSSRRQWRRVQGKTIVHTKQTELKIRKATRNKKQDLLPHVQFIDYDRIKKWMADQAIIRDS
jgi:hypothetical protein